MLMLNLVLILESRSMTQDSVKDDVPDTSGHAGISIAKPACGQDNDVLFLILPLKDLVTKSI